MKIGKKLKTRLIRYNTGYLEYFKWDLKSKDPNPAGGFVNKEDRINNNDKRRSA